LGLGFERWWLLHEPAFTAMMVGRYLNDGRGEPPPPAERVLRDLKILGYVTRYRRMDAVIALVEKVDRARRKNAAAHPDRG
jgi:hypothetical protein